MKIWSFLSGFVLLILLHTEAVLCYEPSDTSINIIPKPFFIERFTGNFTINPNTVLSVPVNDTSTYRQASFLRDALKSSTGFSLDIKNERDSTKTNYIKFQLIKDSGQGKEGYILDVEPGSIVIEAEDDQGLFYAVQSLLQLLPYEAFSKSRVTNAEWTVPCLLIKDKPRYAYRGMHLDVSRHFFPKEFIKKYLDLMAMYKMNYFHWHLTDDNGWRIEIKRYPLLTKICAWRVDRENQPWNKWSPIQKGEKATYGGYYTQDDIKEIIKYASERFITIVPEIEMPAHTSEVFAAYPRFSCFGETLNVCPGSYWPNKDIFCAGNDSTFTFIENILREVSELFPGPYIHIGGDEADKSNWKKCPKCQARIRNEVLKDEEDLQSYFVKRINTFVQSLHKKMIGWDEIMEGGTAPGATVMCWNSIFKGSEAAKDGHDVIMTPTKYCYFDYYQADPDFDSLGTGELITLKDVYSFNPTPEDLNESESRHILGAQANLWTEHVKTSERAEYMILPRMLALSEDVWSNPIDKDWTGFLMRLRRHFKIFNEMGLSYSRGSFEVKINPVYDKTDRLFAVSLSSEQPGPEIYYTLNGSNPDKNAFPYTGLFTINKTTTIKAAILGNNAAVQGISEKNIYFGQELGKEIYYADLPAQKYRGDNGNNTLIDGLKGTNYYYDGNWQGFSGKDMDVIVDLGEAAPVHQISMDFLHNISEWIFLPESINISVSGDGIEYRQFLIQPDPTEQRSDSVFVKTYDQKLNNPIIRFIHIKAKNIGLCPSWHIGAGQPAWIFCDEIMVE